MWLFMVVYNVFSLKAQTHLPFEKSNLPLVFVVSQDSIVDDPRVYAYMSIVNNVNGFNYISDQPTDYDGLVTIEIRGATSQSFPKKGYAFETVDALGENNNVSLLGMPEENDWILHGPFTDKSLLRNALVYELGDRIERYAVRRKFCELFVNEDYRGVYLLMERIKRDKNRVDIAKLLPTDTVGDELTGGYILKIDKFNGSFAGSWVSPYPLVGGGTSHFQFHRPKASELHPAQLEYIESHVTAFEDALASDAFDDPVEGYAPFVDMQSFVDMHLVNELTNNIDGFRKSTYFYKEKDSDGGKIVMGPWWDFNLALGNAHYCEGGEIEGFYQVDDEACFHTAPFWFGRLLEDDKYRLLLEKTWARYRSGSWSDASVCAVIDSLSSQLQKASERDHERWPRLGQYVWPNVFIGDSYQQELVYLKSWVLARMHWMDFELTFRDRPEFTMSSLLLKPNPTTGSFALSGEHEGSTLVIYNFHGLKVEEFEVLYDFQLFSIEHLPNGVYVVQRWGEQNQIEGVSKLIKQ